MSNACASNWVKSLPFDRVGVSRARHRQRHCGGASGSAVCVGVIDTASGSPYLPWDVARTALAASQRLHRALPALCAERPPSEPDWVHEIKHDGYRLMARRGPVGIRLLTRNGHDWSPRYPLIVEAVNRLKARSCLIDGEAVVCDKSGLAVFDRLRRRPSGKHVSLYAFDLLELDGQDLRREPLETRKATLASLLRGSLPGLRLNEHLAHDGESVFRHACKLG